MDILPILEIQIYGNNFDTVLSGIEESYLSRCSDQNHARSAWGDVINEYPPEKLHEYANRPSLELTRKAGDLPLALLWIAQAALINPIIGTLIDSETNLATLSLLKEVNQNSIGALAVSEDRESPFSATLEDSKLVLNGRKKYIVGGPYSDFILLTEKNSDDKKPHRMIFIRTKDIPDNSFQNLDLGCLYTSVQSSLMFESLHVPSENILAIDSRSLRKNLKTCGIIEQSLIMEAVAGLALYLADRIFKKAGINQSSLYKGIEENLIRLSVDIDKQIASAMKGEFITPVLPVTEDLSKFLKELKEVSAGLKQQLSHDIDYRLRDMLFFYR